jgi:glutamate-1-semialdehyde 2,1-aminomutase
MAAGLASLRYAAENDVHAHVHDLGDQLRRGLTEIVADQAPEYTVAGVDGIFKLIFTREAPDTVEGHCEAGCRQREACPRIGICPKTGADVAAGETDRWRRVFWPRMREQGIFLAQTQYEAQFVTDAHTEADVEESLEAYKHAF